MSVAEVVTAITAIGALVFTGISLGTTRDQVAIAQQQYKVSEQGQFTDRYTKAVEQLDRAGPDHLQARLGAIYALERLARDSGRDQPAIVEILSAFVRTATPEASGYSNGYISCPVAASSLSTDVEAALTVLGRRIREHDYGIQSDLTFVCLNGVDLYDIDLRGADLNSADLSGSFLFGADLRRADLSGAKMSGVNLRNGDLRGARLFGVDLRGADLRWADVTGAYRDETTVVDGTFTNYATIGEWW